FLRGLRTVRRGRARGRALPIVLPRHDHRQSHVLGPAEGQGPRRRDRLAATAHRRAPRGGVTNVSRLVPNARPIRCTPLRLWRRGWGWGSQCEAAVVRHRTTPLPTPPPAGCGLARFRQILEVSNPGKPGFGWGREQTGSAARTTDIS